MTREEQEDAINFFKKVAEREVNNAKYSKIAIEALEQQPCEDLINQRATTCRHGGHCEWVACDKCNHYEPDHLIQQPCEDCISRQSVLKYIEHIFNQGTGKKKSFEFFEKYVENLPSVTPKKKTGWHIARGMYEDRFWCSCGFIKVMDSKMNEWKYCPVCGGTKMEESE